MSILEPFSVYPTVILTKGVSGMNGWIKYLLPIALIFFLQCRQDEKPEGLLSRDEMVSLMVDMYLAEARINISRVPKDSAAKLFVPFERGQLSRMGISDSTLGANYAFYLERPREFEAILDMVIDTLVLREQRFGDEP